MPWVERLPSGRYRGGYRDGAGKKRFVTGTFTHKPAALREAGAKESEARSKKWRDPEAYKRPWGEWADEWIEARKVEATTAKADSYRRKHHLDERWAEVPIGSITRHDVKAWSTELARKVGPSTVQRCVHLLSASLNAAVDAEVLESNPAARIKLPKGALEQERYLTADEFEMLRGHLPTTDDQLIADVLVNTGLRWSELAGLHWSRIDLKRGLLMVVETYSEAAYQIKPYPKGKQSRTVPLTPELVTALTEYRKDQVRQVTCGIKHAAGICRSGLVFTSIEGRPIRNSKWSDIWREAVAASEVGHVRIHDLRHTYASWLLQQGVPLAEVGRLLGHVSTQTTAKYAHLADTPSAAVLAALKGARGAES